MKKQNIYKQIQILQTIMKQHKYTNKYKYYKQ